MSATDANAFAGSQAPTPTPRIAELPPAAAPGAQVQSGDVTRQRSAFLPVVLFGAAMLGWLGFQCFHLVKERSQLLQTLSAQEQLVQSATSLRGRLDTVARETQLLADSGNPNAKLLVDELRKRGITINPNAPAATPAGAATAAVKK